MARVPCSCSTTPNTSWTRLPAVVARPALEALRRLASSTSREPLGVAGEVVWRVPALDLPDPSAIVPLNDVDRHDAIRLFLTRAREARPGMAVDRQAMAAIASICVELDGMPLALELAAAQLRTLPLSAVAGSINEIVSWKTTTRYLPPGGTPPSVVSIEWSFDLIGSVEQQLMVALAMFSTPFDAAAGAAVATSIGITEGAADVICRLVDVGLLHLDDVSGRYRMLNTVRQFCRQRGAERGTWATAEEAHARHVTAWCEDVGAGRMGLEHRPFLRRMPDVVSAMSWARDHEPEAAFRMCRGLAPVRSVLGHLR